MLIIHFVDENDDQPCCGRPERAEWIWSADPDSVTCPACAAETHRGAERAEDRRASPPPPPSS